MFFFLYVILYFVLGVLTLFLFVYLDRKSIYFQELFDNSDISYFIDEEYPEACAFFAFFLAIYHYFLYCYTPIPFYILHQR